MRQPVNLHDSGFVELHECEEKAIELLDAFCETTGSVDSPFLNYSFPVQGQWRSFIPDAEVDDLCLEELSRVFEALNDAYELIDQFQVASDSRATSKLVAKAMCIAEGVSFVEEELRQLQERQEKSSSGGKGKKILKTQEDQDAAKEIISRYQSDTVGDKAACERARKAIKEELDLAKSPSARTLLKVLAGTY